MEPSQAFAALGLGALIAYLMAEFVGRQKHIGGWWSFIVVFGSISFFFIPGILMVVSSPSAKGKPTAYSWWRLLIGVIIFLWSVYLFVIYFTANAYPAIKTQWLSWAISSIFLGSYMVSLGLGKVVNQRPKFRSNPIQNWLKGTGVILSSKISNPLVSPSVGKGTLYYIVEDNNPVGPLTIQQIQERAPKAGTLVCRNGEKNWSKVEDMNELASFVIYAPPPIGGNVNNQTADQVILTPDVPNHESKKSEVVSSKRQKKVSAAMQAAFDKEERNIYITVMVGGLILLGLAAALS
jgi:hypothetical protein